MPGGLLRVKRWMRCGFHKVYTLLAQFLATIARLIVTKKPHGFRRFHVARQFSEQRNFILFFPAPEANRDGWIYTVFL